MAYQVSPGIDVNEVDQTNVVPATSTTIGAYAGHFNWGPADDIVTVGSEKELAENFGSPANGVNTRSFLTAASFLKYSNALRVSRAIGSGALNAADSNSVLIKNKDHFDSLTGLNFVFSARYPGTIGNSLTVSYAHVSGAADSAYDNWPYKGLFTSAPNRSLTAEAEMAGLPNIEKTNDEIHLVVIDTLGLITGTKGTVLERFEGLSLGSNAKTEDGASIYYKDVINNTSSYIYVNTLSATFDAADAPITEDSVFAVANSATENVSNLTLPFIQTVETSVTYSGGTPVVTSTTAPTNVTVFSGYEGMIGNNAKVNVRLVDVGAAPAKAAHGFVKYGVPVNGDTLTIDIDGAVVTEDPVVFTKAAVGNAPAFEFSTIGELESLIEAVSGLTSSVVGGYIYIVGDATGVAGNAVTLAVSGPGGIQAGTMGVSGPTLVGGVAAASDKYIDVAVDVLAAATGYVTYDVSIAADTLVVGPVTTNVTSVSLADIIAEIEIESALADDAALESLTFLVNGEVVTDLDAEAAMIFNIESVLPYSALAQSTLEIIPFTGGEVVSYTENTLVATVPLVGGANGAVTAGNVATALGVFADKELVDINFLFAEAFDTGYETVDSAVYDIANSRKDIVATISAPVNLASFTSDTLKKNAVINKFDGPIYSSSSFVVFDETPVYTYNKYADTYVWIPAAGHMAGLCANADLVADPWFSPAGYNRGQLKGVTKIAYNPTKTDRDELYKKRINSIVSVPGEGVILYGDKTALTKPSAFDRINVRRLFNIIQRSISNAAKYQLFELNDEFTRATFRNTIEPYLRDVQGRRGITEFKVVCDEFNNTAEVIDRNEFVGDIYVKPTRSINFIQLNFIATRTGVDFKEIVGASA
jgi:hypothetical protein